MTEPRFTAADLTYIAENFLTLDALCEGRAESPSEVEELILAGWLPGPAYVIDDGPLADSELAARAKIAASTASEHLSRLVGGGFLVAEKRGKRRYHRLASPQVATAVEGLMAVAPPVSVNSLRSATRSELLRRARTCYDHLAGGLGVEIAGALEGRGVLVRAGGGYALGPRLDLLAELEIEIDALRRRRRPAVRACLDWSERELHLGGGLGAAIAGRLFELDWLERRPGNARSR